MPISSRPNPEGAAILNDDNNFYENAIFWQFGKQTKPLKLTLSQKSKLLFEPRTIEIEVEYTTISMPGTKLKCIDTCGFV